MKLETLNEIANLWTTVLRDLSTSIDKAFYDSFLKETYIHDVSGDKLIIACNSSLSASILNQQYKDLITSITNKYTGSNFNLVFLNEKDLNENSIKEAENHSKNMFKSTPLDPNFTFDSFVTGQSNLQASQASLIVASSPAQFYNPLFIYGGSGLGKTHLLNAIGNYIKERNASLKILYVTSQDFLYQYLDYVNSNDKNEQLSKHIKNYDVFLIDDIQMLKDKKRTLEFFFDIYQYFIQNKKQIVLTSDRLPSELNGIDARLVTRFMDGLTVQVLKPSIEMCEDILKKKIVGSNLAVEDFDPEVITFVAQQFKNSVRELNGALNRIIFIKNIQHASRITMQLAYDALSGIINLKTNNKNAVISEQTILNEVANYYSLSVNQLTGKLKNANIVYARHIAIYLIRYILNLPLKNIGDIFGGRDHTTIMHSISKVEELLKTDKLTVEAVNDLKKRLNQINNN